MFSSTGFNTQPPEGGWYPELVREVGERQFQHTAARRRLVAQPKKSDADYKVSTHSRPKAAGLELSSLKAIQIVSTHSRPKAAGKRRH